MEPMQMIKEEYGMTAANPDKQISITLEKLASMMKKYSDHVQGKGKK